MARRRFQAKGSLEKRNGYWRFRYREDVVDTEGRIQRVRKSERIGPSRGPQAMTKAQAQSWADKYILPRVNMATGPAITVSLTEFVDRAFRPDVIRRKRRTTQRTYESLLKRFVTPRLGTTRLREIGRAEVSDAMFAALDAGLSTQTARHVRNLLSSIFEHAKAVGAFTGDNPARLVKPPEITRRETFAYTWEQARQILENLRRPVHEMAYIGLVTGMRVGELRGLRWMRINLAPEWVIQGGESIPPFSLIVRDQYTEAGYVAPKTRSGRRTIPLDGESVAILAALKVSQQHNGPDHPVFQSVHKKSGRVTPVDAHNVARRVFWPLSRRLGFRINWHTFRHSHTTWLEQGGVPLTAMRAQLGHSSAEMTMRYAHGRIEDQRRGVGFVAANLAGKKGALQ